MVPKVANPSGHSFAGAGLYYLHDKGALTSERVAFTHTENTHTNDPGKALKVMAWTASHARDLKAAAGFAFSGRKAKGPVFTMSLAWEPGETPAHAHMIGQAREVQALLGFAEHEAVYVGHADTAHSHVHLIVNRVHPETGRTADPGMSHLKLSQWAEAYEQEHGQIRCARRVENNARRRAGQIARDRAGPNPAPVKTRITALYDQAGSPQAFKAALEAEGFRLAKGNRRTLVVGRDGTPYNLFRQIEGHKAPAIKDRLGPVLSGLPELDELRREQAAGHRDRDAHAAREEEKAQAAGIDQALREDVAGQAAGQQKEQERQQEAGRRREAQKEAAAQVEALRQRHKAELEALAAQKRQDIETRLESAFAAKIAGAQEAAEQARARIKSARGLKGFVRTLTGQARRDRERLKQAETVLKNLKAARQAEKTNAGLAARQAIEALRAAQEPELQEAKRVYMERKARGFPDQPPRREEARRPPEAAMEQDNRLQALRQARAEEIPLRERLRAEMDRAARAPPAWRSPQQGQGESTGDRLRREMNEAARPAPAEQSRSESTRDRLRREVNEAGQGLPGPDRSAGTGPGPGPTPGRGRTMAPA